MNAKPMNEFAITFGQKYHREEHVTLPGVTPDHYVIVEADDEDTARAAVFEWLGMSWASMYPLAEFDAERWAPRGEFARISATQGGAA